MGPGGAGEGVIQFVLHHREGAAPPRECVDALEAVRETLFNLGLIGQDPDRYDGLGFGNVSMRCKSGFVITGTQTGHLPALRPEHYVTVLRWDMKGFSLCSEGSVMPSSEAMTHAMIYEVLVGVGAVLHVHSPDAWRRLRTAGIAETPAEAGYGSPAMADAVTYLAGQHHWQQCGVFAMAGHEDGLVAFGADLGQATIVLLEALQAV